MNSALEDALHVTGWMYEHELAVFARTAADLKPGADGLRLGRDGAQLVGGRTESAGEFADHLGRHLPERDMGPDGRRILNERGGSAPNDFMNVLNEVRSMRPDPHDPDHHELSVEAAEQVADKSCDIVFIDPTIGRPAPRTISGYGDRS